MVSLAVTAIAVIGLFLFFKNRMAKIEQKVNLMFQLIQEHNTAQELARAQMMAQSRRPGPPHAQMARAAAQPQSAGGNDGLIEISDDEGEQSTGSADATDSEEVSDSDGGDKLKISAKETVPLGELKGIPLEINGAEVEGKDTLDLDEVSDLEELKEDLDPEEEEAASAEPSAPASPEAAVKTVKMAPVDFTSLRVTELRDRCEEKGLKGYKSLRKPALIDLLLEQEQ